MNELPNINLKAIFTETSTKPCKKIEKRKRPLPISIRVTEKEKARLQEMAGMMAISSFIRKKLFDDDEAKRSKRYTKIQYKPSIDHAEIARLLGMFGQSELARSIIALSLAAQAGELETSPEISNKLEQACDDIHEIKVALIMALGVKPQGERK